MKTIVIEVEDGVLEELLESKRVNEKRVHPQSFARQVYVLLGGIKEVKEVQHPAPDIEP